MIRASKVTVQKVPLKPAEKVVPPEWLELMDRLDKLEAKCRSECSDLCCSGFSGSSPSDK